MSRSDDGTDVLDTANLPACPADDFVYALADEHRISLGQAAVNSQDVDRRTSAMMDDETVFTSTGSGPTFSRGFGNEDEELNRAIEASLQPGPSGHARQMPTMQSTRTQVSANDNRDFALPTGFESEDPELAAAIAASLADVPQSLQPTKAIGATHEESKANSQGSHNIDEDDDDPDFWAAEAGEDEDNDDIPSDDEVQHAQNSSSKKARLDAPEITQQQKPSAKVASPQKEETQNEQEEEELTADEIRRRRLARFA